MIVNEMTKFILNSLIITIFITARAFAAVKGRRAVGANACMMETKAASCCCSSIAVPLTKLLLSLAITILGVPAAGILIPTTQRPLPVQHVPIGGGAILHLPHPDYVHEYVPDSHATCPSVALLGLVVLGLIVTVLLHVRSAARALDAASTYLFAFALTAITTVWGRRRMVRALNATHALAFFVKEIELAHVFQVAEIHFVQRLA